MDSELAKTQEVSHEEALRQLINMQITDPNDQQLYMEQMGFTMQEYQDKAGSKKISWTQLDKQGQIVPNKKNRSSGNPPDMDKGE